MNDLIECKISKEDLKILFEKLCIYENGTGDKKDLKDHESIDCDKCILRNIMYNAGNCERDLCFAIWHDAILTDNLKHYHHNF